MTTCFHTVASKKESLCSVVIVRNLTVVRLAAQHLPYEVAKKIPDSLNTPHGRNENWAAIVPEPLPQPILAAISRTRSTSRSA